ncbi:MAG: hypothetical protein LLG04_01290 [Parachlamydia sp.]|nr:hypothetical protein [Parachlamydia sp.]
MKPKTIFECDEAVLNTPGAVIWGPVQIGRTWTRMAVTEDGGSTIQVFDGNGWERPEADSPEASISLGDIMEEMGFSCPCDECWRKG